MERAIESAAKVLSQGGRLEPESGLLSTAPHEIGQAIADWMGRWAEGTNQSTRHGHAS